MSQLNTASNPVVLIRRASSADLAGLRAFHLKHHPERLRLHDERINAWLFGAQPGAEQEAPFFVLEVDGEIAGGIGYVNTVLEGCGVRTGAVFPVNYFVDPRYKGLPALRLFRAVLAQSATVIGAYVSPDARRLMSKLGFVDRSKDFYGFHYRLSAPDSLRSWAFGGVRRVAESLRRIVMRAVRPAARTRVDEQLDDALAARCAAVPDAIHIAKPRGFLRWRYAQSPVLSCRFVYRLNGAEPIAMAVVHVDAIRKELVILDVLWKERDVPSLVALVDGVIRLARKQGCHMVVSHALSATMRRVFEICLFRSQPSELGMLVFSSDRSVHRTLAESGELHLMLGDTDAY